MSEIIYKVEVKPFSHATLPSCLAGLAGNGWYSFILTELPDNTHCLLTGVIYSSVDRPCGLTLGLLVPLCVLVGSLELHGSTYLDGLDLVDICTRLLREAFLFQLLQQGQGFLLPSFVPFLFLQLHSREQTGQWCWDTASCGYQTHFMGGSQHPGACGAGHNIRGTGGLTAAWSQCGILPQGHSSLGRDPPAVVSMALGTVILTHSRGCNVGCKVRLQDCM